MYHRNASTLLIINLISNYQTEFWFDLLVYNPIAKLALHGPDCTAGIFLCRFSSRGNLVQYNQSIKIIINIYPCPKNFECQN